MKKSGKRCIVWLLTCSMMLSGTLAEAKGAKKPKLSKTSLVMEVGAKKQLTVKNKKEAGVKKTTFSSSKAKVAKVSKTGKVSALKKGTTTITCKVVLKDSKKYNLKCKVTVKKKAETKPSVPQETDAPTNTTAPSETGTPQETVVPSETNTPQVTDSPSSTKAPVHLSKNGIETQDNGVMRDGIDAFDIVWEMGLGTNLGNTMECCGSWIDSSSVSNYETAWGAPITTQEMLTGMKEAGFSSIRIPVGWSNMMSTDGKYTINEEYFKRVETVMNYALNADMYVVINIHFDGGWWARFGSKDATEREEAMKKFKSMWLQIANRFEEYSERVIFESANEELGQRLNWTEDYAGSGYFTTTDQLYETTNAINQAFIDVVRGTGGNNAKRYLTVAGYDTNIDLTCDGRFKMPKDTIDGHLMVSVHYYAPAPFCIANDPNNSWGYSDSWGTEQDIAAMKRDFNTMCTHFVNKGYPVIIGEYGVTDITVDDKIVIKEGRDLFFKTVCEITTANNMCPMLWDANQIYDRRTLSMVDERDKENFLSLSKKIKETPVKKPTFEKGVARWAGQMSYSGWMPKEVLGTDSSNTLSINNLGGCYVIKGIDWSEYEKPVLKVTYTGTEAGATLTSKWYEKVKDDDQYWIYPYPDDTGIITSVDLTKDQETVIDLSGAKLSGDQNLFLAFGGVENMKADITITVQSGN